MEKPESDCWVLRFCHACQFVERSRGTLDPRAFLTIQTLDSSSITTKRAKSWCESKNDIPHIEISAKEALHVDEAFATVARNALAQDSEVELYNEFPDQIKLSPANGSLPRQDNCGC